METVLKITMLLKPENKNIKQSMAATILSIISAVFIQVQKHFFAFSPGSGLPLPEDDGKIASGLPPRAFILSPKCFTYLLNTAYHRSEGNTAS
jgi:hypothetical protein